MATWTFLPKLGETSYLVTDAGDYILVGATETDVLVLWEASNYSFADKNTSNWSFTNKNTT